MKEIVGTSCNLMLSVQNDVLSPYAEIILILSEPHYQVDEAGEITKPRRTETVRFHSSHDGLVLLAKSLVDYAKAGNELLKKHSGATKEGK